MGSRDKDQKARHHQPHISSLVIRPTVSDGPDGGGGGGRGGGGSDYEPGEVRRDLHPYSRAERYHDDPGSLPFLFLSFFLVCSACCLTMVSLSHCACIRFIKRFLI